MTEQEVRQLARYIGEYDSLTQAVAIFLMTHPYIEWDVAYAMAVRLAEREVTNHDYESLGMV